MRFEPAQGTIKLCIAKDVAIQCQQYAQSSGFPLNLTQAVNAALRNHVSAVVSAVKDSNEQGNP